MDLAQVYREHYRSLVRFLYRRTGDAADAEDLAQEAFVRALEHHPPRPRPWLFAVALNLARDRGRRAGVRRGHLRLVRGAAGDRVDTPSPEAEAERRESAGRVRRALAELGERDRESLLLWEEGLSYGEIADVLGLSRGSVGTTLARARGRLAQAYRRASAGGQEGGEQDATP